MPGPSLPGHIMWEWVLGEGSFSPLLLPDIQCLQSFSAGHMENQIQHFSAYMKHHRHEIIIFGCDSSKKMIGLVSVLLMINNLKCGHS